MTRTRFSVVLLALAASALPAAAASAARTDLLPPLRRQQTVDRAAKLAAPPAVQPLPELFTTPFNPPDFDRLDPEEQRPIMPPPPPRPAGAPPPSAQAQAAAANADREVLESLAPRIQPTGTLTGRDGKPMLTFPDARRVRVGEGFIVTDKDQNYELQIVSIDRTTFTLRYRNEEIVRPIRSSAK